VTWPLPPERDHRSERQAEVLAAAFTNRLHAIIRGEMGASYAPESHIIRSELQAEANYLLVSLNCEPGLERKLAERVRELGAELAAQGMTDDEFTRAVQPKRQAAAAQLRNNAYWLHSSVSRAQSRPERLDWPRTRVSDLEQMAADELNALARRVLEPDQA
jgi:zinc protease